MRKLFTFIYRHSRLIILINIVATIGLGYAALNIEMDPNVSTFIPDSKETAEMIERFAPDMGSNLSVFFTVEKEEYTVDDIRELNRVSKEIEDLPWIIGSITPFNALTFRKDGKRLLPGLLLDEGKLPENQEEVNRFIENIENDLFLKTLIHTGDGKAMAFLFYHAVNPENSDLGADEFKAITATLDSGLNLQQGGEILIIRQVSRYIKADLYKLLGLGFFIILLSFHFGFRSKRSILLPVTSVSFGTLWIFGFMSLLGFKLTIVSVVIPPLVLAIGSSFTIHILNQYYRDFSEEGGDKVMAMVTAVYHVIKTIGLASITTVIGFMSLLATTLPVVKDFGIVVSIGIMVCAFHALFLIPALLINMSAPSELSRKTIREGILVRIISALSNFTYQKRWVFFILLLLIGSLYTFFSKRVQGNDNYHNYFPAGDKIISGTKHYLGEYSSNQLVFLSFALPEGDERSFIDTETLSAVNDLEEALLKNPHIRRISSFNGFLKIANGTITGEETFPKNRSLILLMSRYIDIAQRGEGNNEILSTLLDHEHRQMTAAISLSGDRRDEYLNPRELDRLIVESEALFEKFTEETGIETYLWGNDLRYVESEKRMFRDRNISTNIAIVLILIISIISFRSLVYGIVALIPLLSGIMINSLLMVLFQIPLDVMTIMVNCITIGVGVDDAYHYLLHFKKRVNSNITDAELFDQTGQAAGRPIFLTTVSIVSGLLTFLVASFKGIVYFGLLLTFLFTSTMLGTLIFLPAILGLLMDFGLIKRRNDSEDAAQQ